MAFLLFPVASAASAEEWNKVTVVCPVCGAVNTFQTVSGSPSDIYSHPERLQYVFWPYTDKRSLYCCRRCRYTVFMADWNAFPSARAAEIRAALRSLTYNTAVSDYATIPMSARFQLAEKVYQAWAKDDTFMCSFYRAMAWSCDAERMAGEAADARRKATEIAARQLSLELRPGARKELLYIIASMKHATGDDAGALADLKKASEIQYENEKDLVASGVRRDAYLTKLIGELTALISGQSPPGASTASDLKA